MARSTKPPASPDILRWARETCGMDPQEVAARFHSRSVTARRISNWETAESEDSPTGVQLDRLSHIYRRPLIVFFFTETPDPIPLPPDFRCDRARQEKIPPKLHFELRNADARSEMALLLYSELPKAAPRFRLHGERTKQPSEIARRARKALGVSIDQQYGWKTHDHALEAWKSAVERRGVLVSEFAGIDLDVVRGFAISRPRLPAIGVNRQDTPQARIFCLMHELVHLMLRQGGICNLSRCDAPSGGILEVEAFCNAVASEILVPGDIFHAQPEIADGAMANREWPESAILAQSRRFNVPRTSLSAGCLSCLSVRPGSIGTGKRSIGGSLMPVERRCEPVVSRARSSGHGCLATHSPA